VALRDADYASMRAWPESSGLDEWLRIYRRTARRNGAEPDAGRRLLHWARAAGMPRESLSYTCSVVVYEPGAEEFKRAWGDAWATRTLESALATQAIECVARAAAWRPASPAGHTFSIEMVLASW
jgi:hypothetical protein